MIKIDDGNGIACVKDTAITAKTGDTESTFAVVKYADALQGMIVVSIVDKAAASKL